MAIKFSQFVVRTNSSDLSHIVGYNGVDNIQITPTNFLNSALTGTAGQVLFYDTTGVAGDNDLYWDNTNKRLGIGTTSPDVKLDVFGSDGIRTTTNSGALAAGYFAQLRSDYGSNALRLTSRAGDVFRATDFGQAVSILTGTTSSGTSERIHITSSGNVGIGTTSPSQKLSLPDNAKIGLGDSADLQMYHDSFDGYIENFTNHLRIRNQANDKDIILESDNGAGSTTPYITLDGSNVRTQIDREMRFMDTIPAKFGTGGDLQIVHDSFDSYINNFTGNLNIVNLADNKDIIFQSDDGAGGVATYFYLDGSLTTVTPRTVFPDDSVLGFGTGADLQIYHDGTTSNIANYTNNLSIINHFNDGDIKFFSDDGSGGVTEYFRVDGGTGDTRFSKNLRLLDNVRAEFGSSGNFIIRHDGTDTILQNGSGGGNLTLQVAEDDKNMIFQCDDGSGGVTEYLRLDGSNPTVVFSKSSIHTDNIGAYFGTGLDLQIYHDGTNSRIYNETGDIYIRNNADDKNIYFQSDNGSGGVATYFQLDGVNTNVKFSRLAQFLDDVQAMFGNGGDLKMYHNSTSQNGIIENFTNDLVIQNNADDKDIIFKSDDGSGGTTTYFRLDGSFASAGTVYTSFPDNSRATFGNNFELNIYHDGGNSLIVNSNGELLIRDNDTIRLQKNNGENMLRAVADGEVELYHNNVKKLDTRTTGIRITGVSEYADNTAAIAGGLTTGDVYRTGDLLKIVH